MVTKKHIAHKAEDQEGVVHVKTTGSEFDPFETYCGELENLGNELTRTDKKVNCTVCKATFNTLKNGIILK